MSQQSAHSAYAAAEDHVARTRDLYRRFSALHSFSPTPSLWPDLIYVLDEDASFLLVAASSVALVGWDPSEIAGCQVGELLHPADVARFQDVVAGLHAESDGSSLAHLAHRVRRKAGGFVSLDGTAVLQPLDRVRYCLAAPEAAPRWWTGDVSRSVLIVYANVIDTQSPTDGVLPDSQWHGSGFDEPFAANSASDSRRRDPPAFGTVNAVSRPLAAHSSFSESAQDAEMPLVSRGAGAARQPLSPAVWDSAPTDGLNDMAPSPSSPTLSDSQLASPFQRHRSFLPPTDLSYIEAVEMHTGLVFHQGSFRDDLEPPSADGAGDDVETDGEGPARGNRPPAPSNSAPWKQAPEARKTGCLQCAAAESPEWRRGPAGPKTLCNACGLRWAKQQKQQAQSKPKAMKIMPMDEPDTAGESTAKAR